VKYKTSIGNKKLHVCENQQGIHKQSFIQLAAVAKLNYNLSRDPHVEIFKTVLSSGYILILLSIENILASLIETCQGWSRMRNVK